MINIEDFRELIESMDIIAENKLKMASQFYYCLVKSVSNNKCTIVFNNKEYVVPFYGGSPEANKTYAVFLPQNNMNQAFVIGDGKDGGTEGKIVPISEGGTGADNVPDAIANFGIINLIYPIGSIYMSVNSTSPATLFGGTWEQLENRFLLGAGSDYIAGDTGGSATMVHTHTMSHTHNLDSNGYAKMTIYTEGSRIAYREKSGCPAWTTTWRTASTGQASGSYSSSSTWGAELGGRTEGASATNTGAASNTDNMPPYLAVYMWKRIA